MTTVAGMVAARANDERRGVLDASGTWTWREAVTEGAARGALARSLMGTGVPPHIGVLLPNGPEYLFWLNGAALAGAAIVGINPTRRGEALAADVRATDCALIVTDEEGAALSEGLDLGPGLGQSGDKILVVGTPRYEALLSEHRGGAAARDLVDNAGEVREESLYLLIFTSGTTGLPKAVRCTQGRLAGIAEVAAPGYGYTAEDVCYCPMPLFHGNALMALWGPSVMVGATIATRPRFSASAFMDDVRRFGATKFSYVGKAIAYILATPEHPDDADNTLKSAFGTEASLRDRKRFYKRFDCYLIEGYGQSEGGASINPVLGMPAGAVGKPVNNVDLTVMDSETGKECARAEFDADGKLLNAGQAIGEIVNRSGRGSFEGYYKREDAEQDRLRGGFYWTGDLGYVDTEGFFYFVGRSGDWLRVDSENFAAGPVEGILSRDPDLTVVAVYPVPDTESGAGDQVMAAVETVPGRPFDPDVFANGSRCSPTSARSGSHGTCASRSRSRRRRPAKSPRWVCDKRRGSATSPCGGDRSGRQAPRSSLSPMETGPRWPPGWPRTDGRRCDPSADVFGQFGDDVGAHRQDVEYAAEVRDPMVAVLQRGSGPTRVLVGAPDVDRGHAHPAGAAHIWFP